MTANGSSFRLDGKVALITGAGRGIGAKCAEVLSEAGAKVVVTDILRDEGEAVVCAIRRAGRDAVFHPLAVSEEDQWSAAVQTAVQTFGGLDVVVNNAGIGPISLIENTSLKDFRQVMAVNVDGVFLGTKHGIIAMKPGGIAGRGGSIINMASVCAMVAFYAASAYTASKGAVRAMTKVAAIECGRNGYGIRVNSVHPGVIRTNMLVEGAATQEKLGLIPKAEEAEALYTAATPIGRLGESLDIAQAVLYLASPASSFVTGAELVVDGGFIAV
ncbi:MAG: glucose 1-dehydrogenase [Terriglobales bacterium]